MPENIILSSSYSFQITIDGITDENEYFYSIEGLSTEFKIREYLAGCTMNAMSLTTSKENQPIIVKRPLSNVFEPVSMNIFILNHDETINNHWIAENAYPTGLKISKINIENKNPVIMEIITIMYMNLKRVK